MNKKVYSLFFMLTLLSLLAGCQDVDDSVFIPPINFSIEKSGCSVNDVAAVLNFYQDYNGTIQVNFVNRMYYYGNNKNITNTFTQMIAAKADSVIPLNVQYKNASKESFEVCIGTECHLAETCDSPSNINVKCLMLSESNDLCNSEKKCTYSASSCVKLTCDMLISKDNCTSHSDCIWKPYSLNGYNGYCEIRDCMDYNSFSECQKNNCTWFTNDCFNTPAMYITDSQRCTSSGFEWYGTYCDKSSCYSILNEAECKAKANCEWGNNNCYPFHEY